MMIVMITRFGVNLFFFSENMYRGFRTSSCVYVSWILSGSNVSGAHHRPSMHFLTHLSICNDQVVYI